MGAFPSIPADRAKRASVAAFAVACGALLIVASMRADGAASMAGAPATAALAAAAPATAAPNAGSQGNPVSLDTEIPLADGWEFHWGDPAGVSDDALPAWAEGATDDAWQPFDVRLSPPGRADHKVVWYRIRLPAQIPAGTTLFIPGAYQLFQVTGGGKFLYKWGEFSQRGADRFLGSPYHMIPLPPALAGRHLFIRLFSEFKNIAICGEMLLGRPEQHIRYMITKDLARVVLGCFFMIIGVFQLFLFRRRSGLQEYLAFGMFAFLYGLHAVSRTQVRHLLFYDPVAWKYIEILTITAVPVGLLMFVETVFGAGYRKSLRRMWQANSVAVLALPFAMHDLGLLEAELGFFQTFFAPGCGALIIGSGIQAFKGHRDAVIFMIGLVCLAVPGALDGLVVGGTLPWFEPVSPWGVLGFLCALQVILSRRLAAERRERFSLERELETAAILSSTFLPATRILHDRYRIEVVFKPADKLGGDWFAYYLYQNRYLHVHIGDVTGHGPASALTAAFAKGATDMLYSKLEGDGSPDVPLDQLHNNLNQLLSGSSNTQALMTLFSVAVDLSTGRMEYINSGHLVQFVCSSSALTDAVLTGRGRTLLGLGREARTEKADRLALSGDETIFMFSDGLIEAIGRNDGRGVKAFFELLKRSAHMDIGSVRDLILSLINKGGIVAGKGDDITFIIIKMNLVAAAAGEPPQAKVIPLVQVR